MQTSETILCVRSASHRPLASRRDGISPPRLARSFLTFEAELGFSGIHCIMFSGSAFASAPLSTTAEIFTIPFLVRTSATWPKIVSLSPSHSDPRTVPRLSQHPCRLERGWRFRKFPGHHGPSSLTEGITESWWRAHLARLAAKVSQLECLVVFCRPAFAFIGVFSFRRVLLQVINPSSTGAQPRGVSNPSAHVAFEAFFLAFGLASTLAFAFALPSRQK